ncbi:MAG: GNAT family N-acetyltransferase, partial [Flavobacteriales bacterium]|nr:GNAT family N-acetyltransferase [Flavobacteriales bacterium]
MSISKALPVSWFSDPLWSNGLATWGDIANQKLLVKGRIKGIRALYTPPGAMHVALDTPICWENLGKSNFPCVVVDLPPGMPCDADSDWMIQERHTRQLNWLRESDNPVEELPKHRLKQIRKGERYGLRVELSSDQDRIVSLHQVARKRKQLPSDATLVRSQLESVLKSPHQTSYVVQDENGEDLASAVFLHEQGRTIYAFGGQKRSKQSAWASVMLIAKGIEAAHERGNTCFDFGGSMDPGVDQFYAEFDAQAVSKLRCTRVA